MSERITFDVALAARALAQVSAALVADRSGIDQHRLRAFERGIAQISEAESAALRHALEHYGVEFIPESDSRGAGVRKRFGGAMVERVEGWEDEGGIVGEDDV